MNLPHSCLYFHDFRTAMNPPPPSLRCHGTVYLSDLRTGGKGETRTSPGRGTQQGRLGPVGAMTEPHQPGRQNRPRFIPWNCGLLNHVLDSRDEILGAFGQPAAWQFVLGSQGFGGIRGSRLTRRSLGPSICWSSVRPPSQFEIGCHQRAQTRTATRAGTNARWVMRIGWRFAGEEFSPRFRCVGFGGPSVGVRDGATAGWQKGGKWRVGKTSKRVLSSAAVPPWTNHRLDAGNHRKQNERS